MGAGVSLQQRPHQATINLDGGSGDVGSLLRGQKGNEGSQFFRFTDAAHRDIAGHLFERRFFAHPLLRSFVDVI